MAVCESNVIAIRVNVFNNNMRKLLILAFLLYNIVGLTMPTEDYNDPDDQKRHNDDRKNWRKKALQKPTELDNVRRPQFNGGVQYLDDPPQNYGPADHREHDPVNYKNQRRYYDYNERYVPGNHYEREQMQFMDKEVNRKQPLSMNCDHPYERYEPCFSGCAAVSCDNPRERMRPCYPFCEAGCICVHPYVRDDRTHKCVLPEECSKGLKGVPDLNDDI